MQEGSRGVVLEERLQEHANGAKNTDEDKDPEEETVDHHGYILPVLTHLDRGDKGGRGISHMMQDRSEMGTGCSHTHAPHSSPSMTPQRLFQSMAPNLPA